MHPLTIFFLLEFFGEAVFKSRENYVKARAVVSFITAQNQTKGAIGVLCWDKDIILEMAKNLSRNSVPNNFVSDFNTHTTFFNKDRTALIFDMECNITNSNLYKQRKRDIFDQWIIIDFQQTFDYNFFHFNSNTRLYIVRKSSKYTIQFILILRVSRRMKHIEERVIGNWSEESINHSRTQTFLSNLLGNTVITSYVVNNNRTLEHLTDYRYIDIDSSTKLNYQLMNILCTYINATPESIWAQNFGIKNVFTKRYANGILSHLQSGMADIAGTEVLADKAYLEDFNFLIPPVKDDLKFVFQAPPLSYTRNLFSSSFNKYSWYSCGGIVIVSSLAIYVIALSERRRNGTTTLSDVAILIVSAITQRGGTLELWSISGKTATFVVFLTFLWFYTAFSGRIVVLMQSRTNDLNDLESLYEANMDMGIENTTYNVYFFELPNEWSDKEMSTKILENKIYQRGRPPNYLSVYEGMKMVHEKFFAFHTRLSSANLWIKRLFTEEQKCGVKTVPTIVRIGVTYLVTSKDLIYTKSLLIGYRKLFEHGIHSREHRKFYNEKPECYGTGSRFVHVGLRESYFAFVIFGVGLNASLVIFIIEKTIHLSTEPKKKHDVIQSKTHRPSLFSYTN